MLTASRGDEMWLDAVDAPFRILDEFDVFMDMVRSTGEVVWPYAVASWYEILLVVHIGCVWGRHTLRFYQSGGTWSGITNHQVTVLGADIPSWFVMHISLFNLFGTFYLWWNEEYFAWLWRCSFCFAWTCIVRSGYQSNHTEPRTWVSYRPAWWLWYDLSSGCSF